MSYKKEKIAIPKQLDEVVNKAIYDGLSTPLKKNQGFKIFGGTLLIHSFCNISKYSSCIC